MIEVIRELHPTARKAYRCMACDYLRDNLGSFKLTFAEARHVVRARQQNWTIQPGQVYLKQINKYDTVIYPFRAFPEIHRICTKNELYDI